MHSMDKHNWNIFIRVYKVLYGNQVSCESHARNKVLLFNVEHLNSRVANVRHSHVVFLKFSTAIFKRSDSLLLDCVKLVRVFLSEFCMCLSLDGEYIFLSSR